MVQDRLLRDPSGLPPIDIIVPVHGKQGMTAECINSIYAHTQVPFHLILMDDTASSRKYGARNPIESWDTTDIYLREFAKTKTNITYIEREYPYVNGNTFFEDGFKYCKHDYVATIMNSMTVEPDWEIVGLKIMESDPKVGVIGFKCLFPEGKIESAGIFFYKHQPSDYGRDLAGHRTSEVVEVPAVQWAFALVRKKACQGNLDLTGYHGFVGWDDIDNCMEVKRRGWKIIYCGQGVGIHYPRATRGSNELEAQILNRENSYTFYRKWGLWEEYISEVMRMDVSNKLSKETKQVVGNAVLEAQVLAHILDEKKKGLGELSLTALKELNVSPDDWVLEVNPLAGQWTLKPKQLPPAPEGKPKIVDLPEHQPVLLETDNNGHQEPPILTEAENKS